MFLTETVMAVSSKVHIWLALEFEVLKKQLWGGLRNIWNLLWAAIDQEFIMWTFCIASVFRGRLYFEQTGDEKYESWQWCIKANFKNPFNSLELNLLKKLHIQRWERVYKHSKKRIAIEIENYIFSTFFLFSLRKGGFVKSVIG